MRKSKLGLFAIKSKLRVVEGSLNFRVGKLKVKKTKF